MTARGARFARMHEFISGNPITRLPLLPFALVWEGIAAARRWLYGRGLCRVRRLDRPVVGVGNLAVGGAGKTPFVAFLGQYLLNHGVKVGVVSRGYGRESRGLVVVRKAGEGIKVGESLGGDEPLMLARALPQATILVNEDRAAGGAKAINDFGCEAVVLDDAFQYLEIVKDLNILLIDVRRRPGPTLPAGIYREGIGAAGDADLIVFTKCRAGDYREFWKTALASAGVRAPLVEAAYAPAYLRMLNQPERLALKNLVGAKVLALAAVADFEGFAADLTEAGAVVARRRPFPDHHRFDHAELADAEGTALVAGCDFLITTAKDEARLEGWRPRVLTYVLEQQVEILSGFDTFNECLDRIVAAAIRTEPARGR